MDKRLFPLRVFLLLVFIGTGAWAQIKIGENIDTISPEALLELESTTQGLLIPRMTSVQRDAAFDQETPVGMVIFNIDANSLQFFMEEIDPTSKKRTGRKVWESSSDQVPGATTLPATGTLGDLFFDTDDQTLSYFDGTQWLPAAMVQSNIIEGDTLVYTESDGTTQTLHLPSLIESRTIALGPSNSSTQTTLGIPGGNALNLHASGALSFSQTGTHTLELIVPSNASGLASGTIDGATLHWENDSWRENPDLISNDTNTAITALQEISLTSQNRILLSSTNTLTLTSQEAISLTSTTALSAALIDGHGSTGAPGQLLSSTGTETQWITTGVLPATAGQNTNTTAYWNGSAWRNNQKLLTDGSMNTTLTTDFSVIATNTTIDSNLDVIGDAISLTGTTTQNGGAFTVNAAGDMDLSASNEAQISSTNTLTLSAGTQISLTATTSLENAVLDSKGYPGLSGQVLSSTGTQTSWISISGETVTSTTSSYTASVDDNTIVVLPAAAVTITLPTPAGTDNGKKLTIKRGNAYTGPTDTLAVVPSSGTIDGATTLRLNVGYQGYTLQAFGGNWIIIQRF